MAGVHCCVTHLREGDILMLADIQGPAELEGLHQQLHSLLMLLMLQEEISCITTLLLSLWSDIITLAVAKCGAKRFSPHQCITPAVQTHCRSDISVLQGKHTASTQQQV